MRERESECLNVVYMYVYLTGNKITLLLLFLFLQSRRVMSVFLRLFPVMLDLIILFTIIM